MAVCPEELKLVALDKDDIEVVSAHVQDARVRVGEILWEPRDHRFIMPVNRFDWMTAVDARDPRITSLRITGLRISPTTGAAGPRCVSSA